MQNNGLNNYNNIDSFSGNGGIIMQSNRLYNYYEMNAFCKNEGIATEFFITEINKRHRIRRGLGLLYALFTKS